MTFVVKDRVRDTCNTVGTGPYIVNGAPPNNFRTFSQVCIFGDTINVFIGNLSSNEWLVAKATYTNTNQLTIRAEDITDGVNGVGVAVAFSAGIKEVFGNVPGLNAWSRDQLKGTRTYYVNAATGDNTNNGLTPTTAFQTIQAAFDFIFANLDPIGWGITLQLADGTYDGGNYVGTPYNAVVNIVGNNANPGNVIILNDGYTCVDVVSNYSGVSFSGITFNEDGGAWGGVIVDASYCAVSVQNCIFTSNGCRFAIFLAGDYNQATVGGFSAPGSMVLNNFVGEGAMFCFQSSDILVSGVSQGGNPWTFSGTVTFSSAFAAADHSSNITFFNPTFSGVTPTGKKYTATTGSNISSQVTLPGSLPGVVDDNSTYNGVGIFHFLTTDITFYVRTDGNDNNDGLTNSAGGAFATIQKAWDTLAKLNGGGNGGNIILGITGTYAGLQGNSVPIGFSGISITGDQNYPTLPNKSSYIINNTLAWNSPQITQLYVSGVRLTGGNGIALFSPAVCTADGVDFACSNNALYAVVPGTQIFVFTAPNVISGGGVNFLSSNSGGQIIFNGGTSWTLTGTPAFSGAFAAADLCGSISAPFASFIGAATGKRYAITNGGAINTFGGGANYFPGNAAGTGGTTAGGGFYA